MRTFIIIKCEMILYLEKTILLVGSPLRKFGDLGSWPRPSPYRSKNLKYADTGSEIFKGEGREKGGMLQAGQEDDNITLTFNRITSMGSGLYPVPRYFYFTPKHLSSRESLNFSIKIATLARLIFGEC